MFKPLKKAEEKIMQAVWKIGEGLTNEIIDELPKPKPHYNTVSTILKILQEKGFITVKNIGKVNCYYPAIQKDEYRKDSMRQYVKKYFSGYYKDMVSFFAKENNITISELEGILNELKTHKN